MVRFSYGNRPNYSFRPDSYIHYRVIILHHTGTYPSTDSHIYVCLSVVSLCPSHTILNTYKINIRVVNSPVVPLELFKLWQRQQLPPPEIPPQQNYSQVVVAWSLANLVERSLPVQTSPNLRTTCCYTFAQPSSQVGQCLMNRDFHQHGVINILDRHTSNKMLSNGVKYKQHIITKFFFFSRLSYDAVLYIFGPDLTNSEAYRLEKI